MLGEVDAVIIARDDHETHLELAQPFLEAGLPVLIDKPLSLDPEALRFFRPYLESGKLMSCSGMRYARELDEVRANLGDYGRLLLLRGAVVLSWEKYGIHLIDAFFGVTHGAAGRGHGASRRRTRRWPSRWTTGPCSRSTPWATTPRLRSTSISGARRRRSSHDVTDNFSMFRRMLWHFDRDDPQPGGPRCPREDTLDAMRLLIAGRMAARERKERAAQ